jgi:hypothetical protein
MCCGINMNMCDVVNVRCVIYHRNSVKVDFMALDTVCVVCDVFPPFVHW